MEEVMPSFEYEPLVQSSKSQTSNEEEDKRGIDGVGPSSIRVAKESKDLKGIKDSHEKEATEQILE